MTRSLAPVLLVAGALVAAACGGGESALDAGDDDPAPTEAPAPTDAGDTGGATTDADSDTEAAPATTEPAATTTVAPLADQPPCPLDALDDADGPVTVTFWHGMANELENALVAATEAYNASQDRVVVELQNQTSYESAIDKYIQSSDASRPSLVQLPEYVVQSFAQSDTFVPVGACIEAAGYDTSTILPRALATYQFEGIQWAMPFNISNPVLYFNRNMFVAAGLDPDDPPVTLEEVRAASQTLVDSGASASGIVLDSGRDSGGGWFFEQWFGRVGLPFADNDNGRSAPATRILFDNDFGREILTWLQEMVADGLAFNVGDNPGGQDAFLKMIDTEPGAMTIATSAAISSVVAALGSGIAEGLGPEDIGIGPMPGPSPEPAAQVGGASLWIPASGSDAEVAAAWDFVTYLAAAETQSTWAADTGYVPIRSDAVDLDPIASLYRDDPRYRVAYDQLLASDDNPAAVVPALGPLREIRAETADAIAAAYAGADVDATITAAAEASNALIESYNARN
jgi:sn-glycerol 3-phosphate transport system substrate-binding protein